MKVIRITAKKDGFRRGGLTHPAQATEYPAERFTAAELAALKAEPMLVVQELDVPAKAAPAGAPEAAKSPSEQSPAKAAEDGDKAAASGDGGKPKTGK